MEFSKGIKQFIGNQVWIFAKTYAKTWPHEYIVGERVENAFFSELAAFIDTCDYKSSAIISPCLAYYWVDSV